MSLDAGFARVSALTDCFFCTIEVCISLYCRQRQKTSLFYHATVFEMGGSADEENEAGAGKGVVVAPNASTPPLVPEAPSFKDLPPDILGLIAARLDVNMVIVMRCVCQDWRDISLFAHVNAAPEEFLEKMRYCWYFERRAAREFKKAPRAGSSSNNCVGGTYGFRELARVVSWMPASSDFTARVKKRSQGGNRRRPQHCPQSTVVSR